MPQKYRKKPVEIEAVQLRWDTWSEVVELAGVGKLSDGAPEGVYVHPTANDEWSQIPEWGDARIGLAIPTLEGVMVAIQDDWIIRGTAGELYPCKPDVFRDCYELVP